MAHKHDGEYCLSFMDMDWETNTFMHISLWLNQDEYQYVQYCKWDYGCDGCIARFACWTCNCKTLWSFNDKRKRSREARAKRKVNSRQATVSV